MSSSAQHHGYKSKYGNPSTDLPEETVGGHPDFTAEVQQKEQPGIEEGGRRTEQPSKPYQSVPSIAEAAEHAHHEPQSRYAPSIAEMAEPLVGGGEPVPFSKGSEGTASRSVAEQADIDLQTAERESHRNAPESAYEGREQRRDQQTSFEKVEPQRVPGAAEFLGMSALPTATQRASIPPDQQAESERRDYQQESERRDYQQESERRDYQQESERRDYQRFEKSGEPTLVSSGSKARPEERGTGQEQRKPFAEQEERGQETRPSDRADIGRGFVLGPAEKQTGLPQGKPIPVTSESEDVSEMAKPCASGDLKQQEQQKQTQTQILPELQPGRRQTASSESSLGEKRPEERKSLSPDEQAGLFYAQGEGYRSSIDKQQPQPLSFGKDEGEEEACPEDEPLYLQAEPRQEHTEGRSLQQREPSGQQRLSSIPAATTGRGLPESEAMMSEFAKMQFPRERFEKPSDISQKQGIKKKAEFSKGESKPIGMGAERGRSVDYEYLPHPRDVQFHVWGPTKQKAFENMASCMFNYLANVDKVHVDPRYDFQFKVIGEDDKELLYKFLDELLFRFIARKQIICKQVVINQLGVDEDGCYRLVATGYGEPYDTGKHGSGKTIKAITLPSLQIKEQPGRTEAFVIVDI